MGTRTPEQPRMTFSFHPESAGTSRIAAIEVLPNRWYLWELRQLVLTQVDNILPRTMTTFYEGKETMRLTPHELGEIRHLPETEKDIRVNDITRTIRDSDTLLIREAPKQEAVSTL